MILLTTALFAFAVADLLRWSPEPVSRSRAFLSAGAATVLALTLAALGGMSGLELYIGAVVMLLGLAVWLLLDGTELGGLGPGYSLGFVGGVVIAGFAVSGSGQPVSGPLATWYGNLPFPALRPISVDQFMLAVAASLFLLATANRVVRLVLEAAGTPATRGETTLRGGRLLGPMERLFVGALIVAGEPTGAAILITAKGLLRLPEIRDSSQQSQGDEDVVTEYFLIGTLASLMLASLLAGMVLAAG